jgi:hypothetical protein
MNDQWREAAVFAQWQREGARDQPDCSGCGAEDPCHRIDGDWFCFKCAVANYPERMREELDVLTGRIDGPAGMSR